MKCTVQSTCLAVIKLILRLCNLKYSVTESEDVTNTKIQIFIITVSLCISLSVHRLAERRSHMSSDLMQKKKKRREK